MKEISNFQTEGDNTEIHLLFANKTENDILMLDDLKSKTKLNLKLTLD